MSKDTGEMIFACGRRYTEVPQKCIDEISVGDKLLVWDNEDFNNPPKPNSVDKSCLACPCKRKAKRKRDMFYHRDDLDSHGAAKRRPTGIKIQCAIAELKPSVK